MAKVLSEDETTFTIEGAAGPTTVAKGGLSPEMVASLAAQRPPDSAYQSYALPKAQDPANTEGLLLASQAMPQGLPQAPLTDMSTSSLNLNLAPQAPAAPPLAAAAPVAAQAPSGLGIQSSALRQIGAAQSEHADNAGKVLGEMQQMAAKNQEAIAQQAEQRKMKVAEVQAELQANSRKLAESAPKDYWADRSTGAKIAAAIAIGMGAYSSGINGGPNGALQIIDGAIKRDLDLQMQKRAAIKDERGEIMNLYQMNMQEFNDSNTARLATYGSMIEQAKLKIEQSAAKSKSSEVKAQAQLMIGQLTSEQEKAHAIVAAKKVENTEKQLETFVAPMGAFATSKEGAAKLQELSADTSKAQAGIASLLRISKIDFKSMSPELAAEANVTARMLQAALRTPILGPGTVQEAERNMLEAIAKDPTKWGSLDSSSRKSLETLSSVLTKNLALTARAYLRSAPTEGPAAGGGGYLGEKN